MADKMQFDLVSPERKLASAEAEMVIIPGMEGDLGAMPGHTPLITTLRPGVVTVHDGGAETAYFVTGGFAEITGEGVSVLAEEAMARGDLTRESVEAMVKAAETALAEASDDARQAAGQRLGDFKAALDQLGL